MAVSRDSTVLPRRTLLKGAAAALVASPAMTALPVLAGAECSVSASTKWGDPIFADMKREMLAAMEYLDRLHAEIGRWDDERGDGPEVPARLLEPMMLPGKKTATPAHMDGWSAKTLSRIVEQGVHLVVEGEDTERGRATLVELQPVGDETRKHAAELLPLRLDYEAQKAAWVQDLHDREDATYPAFHRATKLLYELVLHPVSSIADLRDKMAIAEDYVPADSIEVLERAGGLSAIFMRDVDAIIRKEVSHV